MVCETQTPQTHATQCCRRTSCFNQLVAGVNELTFPFSEKPPTNVEYFSNLAAKVGRGQNLHTRPLSLLHGLKICINIADDALNLGTINFRHLADYLTSANRHFQGQRLYFEMQQRGAYGCCCALCERGGHDV